MDRDDITRISHMAGSCARGTSAAQERLEKIQAMCNHPETILSDTETKCKKCGKTLWSGEARPTAEELASIESACREETALLEKLKQDWEAAQHECQHEEIWKRKSYTPGKFFCIVCIINWSEVEKIRAAKVLLEAE